MNQDKRYVCTWSGTTKDGGFGRPRVCIAKKCNGGPFKARPLCAYYMDTQEVAALYQQQLEDLDVGMPARRTVSE